MYKLIRDQHEILVGSYSCFLHCVPGQQRAPSGGQELRERRGEAVEGHPKRLEPVTRDVDGLGAVGKAVVGAWGCGQAPPGPPCRGAEVRVSLGRLSSAASECRRVGAVSFLGE
jgi:hypothetical protein